MTKDEGQTDKCRVAVVQEIADDPEAINNALETALDLVGGIDLKNACKVVIKPNLTELKAPSTGITSDVRIVEALVRIIQKETSNCEIVIVESDNSSRKASEAFSQLGFTKLEEYNVKLVNLTEDAISVAPFPEGRFFKKIDVPETLRHYDCFISVAKLKTHDKERISCVLKNQFGCIPWKQKSHYHAYLDQALFDLNSFYHPTLCIVDGLFGIEWGGEHVTSGPYKGAARRTKTIVCGRDPVATEIVSAELIGFDPNSIPALRFATRNRLGCNRPKIVSNCEFRATHYGFIPETHFFYNRLALKLTKIGVDLDETHRRLWGAVKKGYSHVPPSLRWFMYRRHHARRRIDLVTAQSNFRIPRHIRQAISKTAADGYHYGYPAEGLLELRKALAERIRDEYQAEYDPRKEILITAGSSAALMACLFSLIRYGDEILISNPCYNAYPHMIELAGGTSKSFSWRDDRDNAIDMNEIEGLITNKTRVLLINSPCNPTGAMLSSRQMKRLAEIVEEHRLTLVSDEVYEKIVYDENRHQSFASIPSLRKSCAKIGSFSKTYSMGSHRVGFVCTDQTLMNRIKHIHASMLLWTHYGGQIGALAALKGPQHFVENTVKEYEERRNILVRGLNQIQGISCLVPQGTFYAFPDISSFGVSSTEVSEMLKDQYRILTVPGVIYGSNGEGHIRLSFAYSSRQEILTALERFQDMSREYTN